MSGVDAPHVYKTPTWKEDVIIAGTIFGSALTFAVIMIICSCRKKRAKRPQRELSDRTRRTTQSKIQEKQQRSSSLGQYSRTSLSSIKSQTIPFPTKVKIILEVKRPVAAVDAGGRFPWIYQEQDGSVGIEMIATDETRLTRTENIEHQEHQPTNITTGNSESIPSFNIDIETTSRGSGAS